MERRLWRASDGEHDDDDDAGGDGDDAGSVGCFHAPLADDERDHESAGPGCCDHDADDDAGGAVAAFPKSWSLFGSRQCSPKALTLALACSSPRRSAAADWAARQRRAAARSNHVSKRAQR